MKVGQQHASQQVLTEPLLGLCPLQRVEPEQGVAAGAEKRGQGGSGHSTSRS